MLLQHSPDPQACKELSNKIEIFLEHKPNRLVGNSVLWEPEVEICKDTSKNFPMVFGLDFCAPPRWQQIS